MTKKAIGAYITIFDNEYKCKSNYYASLGTYNPKTDKDNFGIYDYEIFHYFEGGLKELKKSKGEKITYDLDCTLLDYQLRYKTK